MTSWSSKPTQDSLTRADVTGKAPAKAEICGQEPVRVWERVSKQKQEHRKGFKDQAYFR